MGTMEASGLVVAHVTLHWAGVQFLSKVKFASRNDGRIELECSPQKKN